MIIDFHTHIFPPRFRAERLRYVEKDACFAALYYSPKARIATADELIESMDRDGVDVSVALNLSWSTPELCRETNDYIIESAARFPGRLVGFGSIAFADEEAALAEIKRCAGAGLKGIGELRPDAAFLSSRTNKIVESIQSHNLVLLMHTSEPVGHIYPGKGKITPDLLYPFFNAFPEVTTVCAHWGGGLPFYALMPEVKEATRNVYYDSAASPFLYRPEIFKSVADIAGADRVLLGSDFPLLSQKRLIDEVNKSGLGDESKALILGVNARRLLAR